MITSLRRQIKSKGFQVILWITVIAMVTSGILRFTRDSGHAADSIGKVNGYNLSKNDFARKLNQEYYLIARIKDQLGTDADQYLKQQGYSQRPDERVLQELINEKLITSAVKNLGIKISSEYVEQKIVDPLFIMDSLSDVVPQEAFLKPGGLDMSAVVEFLRRQGISDEEFEEKIRGSIDKFLLNEILASTLYIPVAIVKEQYIRFYVKKKFAIAKFALENYLKKVKENKTQVSDDELKTFFHKNSQLYLEHEKRKGKLWVFEPDKYGAHVTEKELLEHYVRNRKDFIEKPEEISGRQIVLKKDKQKEAQQIVERLRKNPKSFEAEAKKYSTAPDKGAIIVIKRTNKEPRLENAIFALSKDEDFTNPIPTANGISIVQRLSKTETVFKDINKLKDVIKPKVQKDKFAKQFAIDAQRLVSQIQDNPEVFKKFVESKKAKEDTTDYLVKIDLSPATKKLFALRENRKAFYTHENKGYFIELISTQKSNLPEFNSVKNKVLADYYKDKAWTLLLADLRQAREKLASGLTNIESVAKEFKATVETTDFLNPQTKEINQYFEKLKIPTEKINMLSQINSSVEEVSDTNGYIIQLKELDDINEADFLTKKEELYKSLYQGELSLLHGMLLNSLKNRAKITVDNDTIKRYAKLK